MKIYGATALTSLAHLVAFMPADQADVVMVDGPDGQPLRIDRSTYDADQADDGAKQYKLHSDHEKYDANGELMPEHRQEQRNENDKPETIDGNDQSGHGAQFTDEEKARADRIASTNFGVAQEGKKFFVVDVSNENKRIDDLDGINAKGYKSNKEAWDAVFKVRSEAIPTNPMPATAKANLDANNGEDDDDGDKQD